MRAPTISEVAKTAGVSVATVSRVVNGSPSVSHETQARVQEAIERLGYQPNVWGRSLRRGESRVVLVIVPNVSNPCWPSSPGRRTGSTRTATAACCASPMPRRSAGRFTWNF